MWEHIEYAELMDIHDDDYDTEPILETIRLMSNMFAGKGHTDDDRPAVQPPLWKLSIWQITEQPETKRVETKNE